MYKLINLAQNETVPNTVLTQKLEVWISEYLGVQYTTGGIILGCFIVACATLLTYELTKSEPVTFLIALIGAGFCTVAGMLPTWILFISW